MHNTINNSCKLGFIIILLLFCHPAQASHIIGGDFTYTYQGDSMASSGISYHKYQVSLSIYEDCLSGDPGAIAQDNPAFFGVFDASGYRMILDTNVYFSSSVMVPNVISTPCGTDVSSINACLIKKTFVRTYALPPSTTGYTVAFQRCCRNATIINIPDPGDDGMTYYCRIPPDALINSSAVFTNEPPQIICINAPLHYDYSATDADGDSLSYAFGTAINGATGPNNKPYPLPPPYDTIQYLPPFSPQAPLSGSPGMTIDPATGIISGTPDHLGRYLVTVLCYEWRGGVVIDTLRREFQFIVYECDLTDYKPFAGNDTTIMTGDSIDFHATYAHNYLWSPGAYLSSTTVGNPVGYFPDAGHFTYVLQGVSDSGCTGSDTVTVNVLDHTIFAVPNVFSPNGDNLNDWLVPFPVPNATLISFRIYNGMGDLVYNGSPNDPGWDGNYHGKKQPQGVYSWNIIYKDAAGTTRRSHGNVTLIR